MITKNIMEAAFVILALATLVIASGISTTEAIWPFDQMNSSQQANQTGNQSSTASNPTSPGQSGNPGY